MRSHPGNQEKTKMEIEEVWRSRVDASTKKANAFLYLIYSYATTILFVLVALYTIYVLYTLASRMSFISKTRYGRRQGKVKKST